MQSSRPYECVEIHSASSFSAFAVVGEKQQEEAEQDTEAGFHRLPGSPDIEHAQKVEEGFHKDFDGLDYGKP